MKYPKPAFFALLILIFTSCSDDETIPVKGNYFPMMKGSQWTYEQKRACDWPDATKMCIETFQAKVLNESLEWDDKYKGIQHPAGSFQFVKVNDSEYFGMGFYLPEYKFLDDELPVGDKWGDEDEFSYHRFEIMEVNAFKKIKGKTYSNVIVVKQETSYGGDHLIVNVHYYAKNIGMIYRKQTVTYKDRAAEVIEISLTKYFLSRQ
jgi:hypothetical protein